MSNTSSVHSGTKWGALLVACTGIGCATIAGLDEDFQRAPGCNPIVPPTAPAATSSINEVQFSVAIRAIDLDEEDETPRFGYDLDNACSCSVDGPSCARPVWVDLKKEVCDDIRGLDNGAGVALARINALAAGAVSSLIINDGATLGRWSLLIRVSGYSGEPDDSNVTVAVYETPGMDAPAWNGVDTWPISNTSVVAGSMSVDEPLRVDTSAFVRGNILVARFADVRLPFRADSVYLPVNLQQATLTARISPSSVGPYRLSEGTIAAKWPLPSVFDALSAFRYGPGASDNLCRDDIIYLQVRNMFCSVTDILLESGPDTANTPCNAISFGMRFDTEAANLGMVTSPLAEPVSECDPGFDPKTDSCGK